MGIWQDGFEKYGITTRLISYHKFSETSRVELFLNYLNEGKSIALVSDAGTPLISDPGAVLVGAVINAGFRVIPIVGASAVVGLLSAIPREDEDFKFIGFLPTFFGNPLIFRKNICIIWVITEFLSR